MDILQNELNFSRHFGDAWTIRHPRRLASPRPYKGEGFGRFEANLDRRLQSFGDRLSSARKLPLSVFERGFDFAVNRVAIPSPGIIRSKE
jgi:hypothetical protein